MERSVAMTTPATPEELFAGAYEEAGRMARRIVARWEMSRCGTRWSGDLQSAAMERLWLCAVRFDASQDKPFEHYWRTTIRGALIDELRELTGARRVRPPSYRTLLEEDRADDDRTPEDIAVANIAMEELEAAVATLPRDLRVAIDGCREGATQRAIGVAEGVTEGAIGQRKIIARRMLNRLDPRAA